ncbi:MULTISPECIES: hypothetical protein [Clostridium]|uniref:Uncharacterized protein n=1 Tax=Clostridium frigoriphilum TaxID=443253 RepID=A0ABU7UXR2_9CLOT|nr:hypothetical protein [Clostridium sp. DSM 17811]MBU3102219.1 hypothetical protein [Clostridium sp. DSM 17811]
MKIPDEIALMSLFECEPEMLDKGVPFIYNKATYKFSNRNNEQFIVSIAPAYGDIKIQVNIAGTNELLSYLDLENAELIDIISDKKDESKMMITSKNIIIKINFKPKYKISISQS